MAILLNGFRVASLIAIWTLLLPAILFTGCAEETSQTDRERYGWNWDASSEYKRAQAQQTAYRKAPSTQPTQPADSKVLILAGESPTVSYNEPASRPAPAAAAKTAEKDKAVPQTPATMPANTEKPAAQRAVVSRVEPGQSAAMMTQTKPVETRPAETKPATMPTPKPMILPLTQPASAPATVQPQPVQQAVIQPQKTQIEILPQQNNPKLTAGKSEPQKPPAKIAEPQTQPAAANMDPVEFTPEPAVEDNKEANIESHERATEKTPAAVKTPAKHPADDDGEWQIKPAPIQPPTSPAEKSRTVVAELPENAGHTASDNKAADQTYVVKTDKNPGQVSDKSNNHDWQLPARDNTAQPATRPADQKTKQKPVVVLDDYDYIVVPADKSAGNK